MVLNKTDLSAIRRVMQIALMADLADNDGVYENHGTLMTWKLVHADLEDLLTDLEINQGSQDMR